jgi:hypothetical protein
MPFKDKAARTKWMREWQDRLVAEGKCQSCRNPNPAPHLNSRLCPGCNERHKASKRKSQNAIRADIHAQIAALQAKLKGKRR